MVDFVHNVLWLLLNFFYQIHELWLQFWVKDLATILDMSYCIAVMTFQVRVLTLGLGKQPLTKTNNWIHLTELNSTFGLGLHLPLIDWNETKHESFQPQTQMGYLQPLLKKKQWTNTSIAKTCYSTCFDTMLIFKLYCCISFMETLYDVEGI